MTAPLQDIPGTIYLLCHEADRDSIFDLYAALEDNDIDVLLPQFRGKPHALRESEHNNLMSCDAAILYYGSGDDDWLYSKEVVLEKMARHHRDGSNFKVYVYLARKLPQQEISMLNAWGRPVFDGAEVEPEKVITGLFHPVNPS